MSGRRAKKTLRATALRLLLPRLVVFLTGCLVLAFGQALTVAPSTGASAATADLTLRVPAWSDADQRQHPECTPAADWPAARPAAAVVVESVRDGVHRRISFDRAWRLNHNGTDVDDLWVLGVCG
jgi:hypothetical protein